MTISKFLIVGAIINVCVIILNTFSFFLHSDHAYIHMLGALLAMVAFKICVLVWRNLDVI